MKNLILHQLVYLQGRSTLLLFNFHKIADLRIVVAMTIMSLEVMLHHRCLWNGSSVFSKIKILKSPGTVNLASSRLGDPQLWHPVGFLLIYQTDQMWELLVTNHSCFVHIYSIENYLSIDFVNFIGQCRIGICLDTDSACSDMFSCNHSTC